MNLGGKKIRIDQTNNSYIFPGLALGIIASNARRVTDTMIMAAARESAGADAEARAGTFCHRLQVGSRPPLRRSRLEPSMGKLRLPTKIVCPAKSKPTSGTRSTSPTNPTRPLPPKKSPVALDRCLDPASPHLTSCPQRQVGAPSFASFAKGGNHERPPVGCHSRFLQALVEWEVPAGDAWVLDRILLMYLH